MLKRSASIILILVTALLMGYESHKLSLAFYVISPLFLFPLVYFFYIQNRFLLFSTALTLIVLFVEQFIASQHASRVFLFGSGYFLLFLSLVGYISKWSKKLGLSQKETEEAKKSLEILHQKHQSRLDSLHHLEKQVSGLLDLFEIARDFSEALSYDVIGDRLQKKVLPELPFKRMSLFLYERYDVENTLPRVYHITADGVEVSNEEGESKEILHKTLKLGQMQKQNGEWYFPLLMQSDLGAAMVVEDANQDDLAKFEVLSAYLGLQFKKVRLYETVKELSIRDSLTGVFVRRHFIERFQEEVMRCLKYNLPLAVLMLDIDHFKRYNDDHGHLAGDAALKQVAALLKENLRKVDIIARYGGEEFVVVMPETRKEGALEAAERIRSSIARYDFKIYQESTRVTISTGVALFPTHYPMSPYDVAEPADVTQKLIRCADLALYRAKEEGRNRVVLYQGT